MNATRLRDIPIDHDSFDADAAKDFVLHQQELQPLPFTLAWHERLKIEFERLGFQRIVLQVIETHAVYDVRMGLGSSGARTQRDVRLLIKRLAKRFGFTVSLGDIVVVFSGSRLRAGFILLPREEEPVAPFDEEAELVV
jgi:hypothetical protein